MDERSQEEMKEKKCGSGCDVETSDHNTSHTTATNSNKTVTSPTSDVKIATPATSASESVKRHPFSVDSLLARTSSKSTSPAHVTSQHKRHMDSDVSNDTGAKAQRLSVASTLQQHSSSLRGDQSHLEHFYRAYHRDRHAMELAMRATPATDPSTCSGRRTAMSPSLNTEPQSPNSSAHSLTDNSEHDVIDDDDDALINIDTDCDDEARTPADVSDDDDVIKKPAAGNTRLGVTQGKENSMQTYHLNVTSLLEKERFASEA